MNEVLRLELGADKSGLWKVAVSHLSQGRVSEGILERAKIKNGGNWLRDYLEATAQTWLDNYERAEEIASHPAFANQKSVVQLLRADIYQHLSLTYFNRLITEYPDSCRAHFVKAQNLAAQDKQEAEAEFRARLRQIPSKPRFPSPSPIIIFPARSTNRLSKGVCASWSWVLIRAWRKCE